MKFVQANFFMGLIFVTSWRPDQLESKSQFLRDFYEILPKYRILVGCLEKHFHMFS